MDETVEGIRRMADGRLGFDVIGRAAHGGRPEEIRLGHSVASGVNVEEQATQRHSGLSKSQGRVSVEPHFGHG